MALWSFRNTSSGVKKSSTRKLGRLDTMPEYVKQEASAVIHADVARVDGSDANSRS